MKLRQDISIGHNLARLRNNFGFTQEQLANEMQLYGCSTTRNIYAQMGTLLLQSLLLYEWSKLFLKLYQQSHLSLLCYNFV